MIDILVVAVGVASSLMALATALRYYLRVRHEQDGLSQVWMLGGSKDVFSPSGASQ